MSLELTIVLGKEYFHNRKTKRFIIQCQRYWRIHRWINTGQHWASQADQLQHPDNSMHSACRKSVWKLHNFFPRVTTIPYCRWLTRKWISLESREPLLLKPSGSMLFILYHKFTGKLCCSVDFTFIVVRCLKLSQVAGDQLNRSRSSRWAWRTQLIGSRKKQRPL